MRCFLPWVCSSLVLQGGVAWAQTPAEPHNVVQFSAQAQQEVAQDWLTVVLQARQSGADMASVSQQLKTVLAHALQSLAKDAQAPSVEVSTGNFAVSPRYGREGQVLDWQGSAEVLVQGRDMQRLAAVVGRVPGMGIASTRYSLSRTASQNLQTELRQQAIANFRQSAQAVARDFGFAGYVLREVSVQNSSEAPQPFAMARSQGVMLAAEAAPLPVQAGKSVVQVTVTGSVQLVHPLP